MERGFYCYTACYAFEHKVESTEWASAKVHRKTTTVTMQLRDAGGAIEESRWGNLESWKLQLIEKLRCITRCITR